MMRKDVSGGQRQISKNPKKKMRKDVLGAGEVKFQKIRKMMRKDVSGGQRSKFKKSKKKDEKRRFRRSKVKIQKIQKKR
jgi:hypothetical protein